MLSYLLADGGVGSSGSGVVHGVELNLKVKRREIRAEEIHGLVVHAGEELVLEVGGFGPEFQEPRSGDLGDSLEGLVGVD